MPTITRLEYPCNGVDPDDSTRVCPWRHQCLRYVLNDIDLPPIRPVFDEARCRDRITHYQREIKPVQGMQGVQGYF